MKRNIIASLIMAFVVSVASLVRPTEVEAFTCGSTTDYHSQYKDDGFFGPTTYWMYEHSGSETPEGGPGHELLDSHDINTWNNQTGFHNGLVNDVSGAHVDGSAQVHVSCGNG